METRIDIDVKDADVTQVLRLLGELAEVNLIVDPDVRCRSTLHLKRLTWQEVFDAALRSCRLGEERLGENLIRVARLDQLARELDEKRKYEEAKNLAGPLRITDRRLVYARAKEMASLVQKFLSPRGQVLFDERTNTLVITDVAR